MLSLERNIASMDVKRSIDKEIEDTEINHDMRHHMNLRVPVPLSDGYTEWTYTMRRNMQEVVPGLYLGPYSAATKSQLPYLFEHGITHIVCVRQDIEAVFIKPNFPDRFKYLVLDIADAVTENIIQHFRTVKSFIDEGLNLSGQVLVHGNAGISRSAALVMAYIMETYNLSQKSAHAVVQQRRLCINPNRGFIAQLREYEPIYQAQKKLPNKQQQSSITRNGKRTIHQLNDTCDYPMDS